MDNTSRSRGGSSGERDKDWDDPRNPGSLSNLGGLGNPGNLGSLGSLGSLGNPINRAEPVAGASGNSEGAGEAVYNTGMAARLTGIAAPTLQAWERRYGFPQTQRTAGGHRLYSEKDIQQLLLVRHRIDRGMQTAQAIKAVQRERPGRANTSDADEESSQALSTIPSSSPSLAEVSGAALGLHATSEQFLAALQRHDLQRADQLMAELIAVYTPDELVLDMFVPVLNRLGHQWSEGQVSVATEHLASGYLRHRMLMWLMSGPPPRQVPPLVLACAPGEWHEGSLLALGMLVRRRRWPMYYLGQSVPLPDLAAFVQQMQPSLVVLVAMTEQSATALIEWPLWLPEVAHSGGPMVGYGGRLFTQHPEWRERVPGVFLGATLQEGVDTIEKLLSERLRD